MKILVTGGTGFTGKALVERLVQDGHEVRALDNKEGYKTHELREMGAEVIIGSVTDAELVDRATQGVEVVHHVAAAFRELDVPEKYYWDVNVEVARIVAETALRHGVRRFVYCSTCGVHGNVDNPPAPETAPIEPADYYQLTKYEGEPVVMDLFEKGLPAVILRPAAIYGPGDPGRFLMIFRRVAKGTFPMFGDGKTFYHPLYIDNLVDAFLLCHGDGVGDGEAYLIADEEYVEIEDLVRRVGRAMDVDVKVPHFPLWPLITLGHVVEKTCKPLRISPPIFPRRVDWFRQDRAFVIDKARADLAYEPRVPLDEGLRRTAEWYRQEGFLPEGR